MGLLLQVSSPWTAAVAVADAGTATVAPRGGKVAPFDGLTLNER